MPFKKGHAANQQGKESRDKEREESSTPIPSTEAASGNDGSQLPDETWNAMSRVLNAIYDYRTEDGFDPSKLFHRKVNKRVIPEYYDTIKEPIALSTIKAKIHRKDYRDVAQFVRDFALIPHNAQVFNRPDSGAFQDALVIKAQLEKQLQLLVNEGLITKEVATLPYLGEIPTYEDVPMEEAGEAEEESSDEEGEEDDEDEVDDLDDEGRPRKKRKGGRGASSIVKREAADDGVPVEKKARGRPPKLLTPTEARIQAILKGIRKPKNQRGALMIKDFDRLPDKQAMPEYYVEIKNPIAYDVLKRKVKRKKYRSVEEFMADVNLMFNNAKEYNQDDSQVYKHATALQIEAGRLYDNEKAKPDDTFADEEGKIPMPNGILHNGDLYKVGDWVHIQNPNDLTKPIPAQIYRTYKASNGQSMVNVCWYYRPEQTVHRFDKHFYPNEVVKTGRYRDHHIEEVEGKCFIMFFTRYFKGRPRGLPEGMEIYVCEARYNEAKHEFNKIKTWASCLPDEVRDKDYEMDLFDHSRKMKKFPSPIAYLLKDEQKETDEFPKVQWGADGAPPKIGAVHRRPRGDRDSAPPEPTPPPPPKLPTPPPRQVAPSQSTYNATPLPQSQPSGPRPVGRPPLSSYTASHPQQYTQPSVPSPAPVRPPSAMSQTSSYTTPQTPQPAPAALPRTIAQSTTNYQTPAAASIPPNPATYPTRPGTQQGSSYRDPPPIEVYVLPDQANLSIPKEIRDQYQQDDTGRVLFFTAPPVAVAVDGGGVGVKGHSVRYLAEKARRAQLLAKKRKVREEELQMEERVGKKIRVEEEARVREEVERLKRRALGVLEEQLRDATVGELSDADLARLGEAQRMAVGQRKAVEAHAGRRVEGRRVRLESGLFGDDWDNRLMG
ncbi:hypothetical protein BAUCODRAFT_30748 [Baudoinia panamericana UAMH 10762]|uniref:Chromatin structure-remodeling complex protein rsc1 n=1 Tax=Baudoinia panamericana (strain UAMH 10762) TaxID=717646 RepID=M2N827_BAUPA|nr:uncharacterized protein BAUCODRAFT_30748 [Baudoinia panamericana UAMH 10762]EMD00274.1 hypothetical protein BAUCODRAFT_30748 [Baudoinia panamericana UAMH 10762]